MLWDTATNVAFNQQKMKDLKVTRRQVQAIYDCLLVNVISQSLQALSVQKIAAYSHPDVASFDGNIQVCPISADP